MTLKKEEKNLVLEHRVGFDFALHADWQGIMVLRESNEVVRNILLYPELQVVLKLL